MQQLSLNYLCYLFLSEAMMKVYQLTGAETRINIARTISELPTMRRVKEKKIKTEAKDAFSRPLFLSSASQSLSNLEWSTKQTSPVVPIV